MKKKRKPPAKLCGGKLTKRPGTCGHSAGWGTEHNGRGRCMFHGGCTQSHVIAAQREELAEAVVTFGLPVDIEPGDALLEEIHITYGVVLFLGSEVRKLAPEELTYGTHRSIGRKVGGKIVDIVIERRAGVVALVKMWQSERRHLVNVCTRALAAGVDERKIRIKEQEAAMFAAALRGMFSDIEALIGVEFAERPELGKIVRKHLTLIQGGAA